MGASEITGIIENKYSSYKETLCKKLSNDFSDNIYVKYGTLFESSVYKYFKHLVENGQIPLIAPHESEGIKDGLGVFVHNNSVFSPDALYVNTHSQKSLGISDNESPIQVIHIIEFKAPAKRSVKNLIKEYHHQLNYAAFVLYNLLQE